VRIAEESAAGSAAHVHNNAITYEVAPDPPARATVAPPPVDAPQTAPPDPTSELPAGQTNTVNSGKAATKKNSNTTKHAVIELTTDAPVGQQRQSGRAANRRSKAQ
jgi:hypothetical protein